MPPSRLGANTSLQLCAFHARPSSAAVTEEMFTTQQLTLFTAASSFTEVIKEIRQPAETLTRFPSLSG
jgi:hypothetical protein